MRTCIGCRKVAPRKNLVRVGRDSGGALVMVPGLPGRGAWLCPGSKEGNPSEDCLEQAVQRRAFGRAFRDPVTTEAVTTLRRTVQERARIEIGAAAGGAAGRD